MDHLRSASFSDQKLSKWKNRKKVTWENGPLQKLVTFKSGSLRNQKLLKLATFENGSLRKCDTLKIVQFTLYSQGTLKMLTNSPIYSKIYLLLLIITAFTVFKYTSII